jgi:hypothetical protein
LLPPQSKRIFLRVSQEQQSVAWFLKEGEATTMRAVPQFNSEYAGKLLARAGEKLAQLRWTWRKVSCETSDLLVVSQRDRSDY